MQLTILGILALGGGILLIYLALNRRPAAAERTRRRRSGDGKVIYLFNDKRDEDAGAADDGDSEASDETDGGFTDVEYSETDAEEPNDDREK
ncbi:MAG: hypothetical protein LBD95_06050 [Clostridiales Family XIII bacterium]|jgi:hypothetical protein|nr:hypothetical protein [Clostridiales Family XIII bacterium]